MLFNVRSTYSLLNSTLSLEDYVTTAKKSGYQMLGLSDYQVLTGALEFYQLCQRHELKPLIGLTIECPGIIDPTHDYPLIIYALNYTGYQELMHLSRLVNAVEPSSVNLWQALRQMNHLVMITPGSQGELEQALANNRPNLAHQIVEAWIDIFGHENVYLGLTIYPYNALSVEQLQMIAKTYQLPMVANQLIHSLTAKDAFSLKVLEAIADHTTIDLSLRQLQGANYLYPKEALEQLYLDHGLGDVLDNSQQLSDRIELEIPVGQSLLPKFATPEGLTSKDYLRQLTYERLTSLNLDDDEIYLERLDYELETIDALGFNDYFLIVWELMAYCHEQNIRTGPGRGSAAGSLVSYLLQITLVDPIAYDLLFERFLNPERATMPDIDIDIPDNKRDQVIQHIVDMYGYEQVAQISTIGTFGAKQAIRDTLRVLDYSNEELRQWAQAIPSSLGITLSQAYEESQALRQLVNQSEITQQIFATACKIEGQPRHVSTHAAAIVINDFALEEVIPVYDRIDQPLMSQYTMHDVEAMGLLKMDFLGLRNLKYIDEMVQAVKHLTDQPFALDAIPLDDSDTLALFSRGQTNGVFQFESPGIQQVLSQVKPTQFEDIVAVNALYRPGPMGQIDHFVKRKHHQEPIRYLHPLLEPILSRTYGIIVYQEQVMEICRQLAGFSLGEADLLRRAMSKKDHQIMAQEEVHFIEGAGQQGIDSTVAKEIYAYIEEFASYGFNRSHAVVYSTLAYQMAYIKVHYPLAFFQVMLSYGDSQYVNLTEYIEEAKRALGSLLPLNINKSYANFSIESNQLRVGLSSVKGLPQQLIHELLHSRQMHGPYTNLLNTLRRLPAHLLKKEPFEHLIQVGAFDTIDYNRRTLVANLDTLIENVKFVGNNLSLFGEIDPKIIPQDNYSQMEQLALEQEILGFHLSAHPLEAYQSLIDRHSQWVTLTQLHELPKRTYVEGLAMLQSIKTIHTKKGDLMAFAELSDTKELMPAVIFPQVYLRSQSYLKDYQIVHYYGRLDTDRRQQLQVVIDRLEAPPVIQETPGNHAITCFIRVTNEEDLNDHLKQLQLLANENPGVARIILVDRHRKTWQLNESYNIGHSHQVIDQVKQLFGYENVVFQQKAD